MSNKIIQYYQKTHFFLICCLVLFPLTPRGVHSSIIITIGAIAIIYFAIRGRKDWTGKKTKHLFALGSIFVIYCFSLLNMGDVDIGMKFIIRTAPTFLIPFAFLNQKNAEWNIKQLQIILFIYFLAISCVLFFLHYSFFEEIHYLQITSWEKRCRIEESLKMHGTYLSMWIGMGVLSVIWLLFQNKIYKKILFVFGVLIIGYFLFWQYFLGARMPLFSTLVASSFLLLTSLRISLRTIVGLYLLSFTIGLIVFWNPIQHKIQELGSHKKAIPEGKYENTNPNISNENIRSAIYYCALINIKEKPLLGYGVGNTDRVMQYCYNQKFDHTDLFTTFRFNAHSQYFQIVLAAGILGLLIFLTSIILWIRWSSGFLYIAFLTLILLCFTFENILSRHDGIVFFSVFNTILLNVKTRLDRI
ncbi:O-antigen ligase family protein [Aquimarina sp. MMG016]|uniref:O-antigen ligase family protein n=1 Tax=Aquimarina sp. MMG016 TaxID=2822690 RepID=UPI001B39D6C9|nr:O-antigen ligase family protein [Aquimarina sp. MMG016]MBQ4820096.1 O-antigen ligase family protein [Aquimarina sp. MMG016]